MRHVLVKGSYSSPKGRTKAQQLATLIKQPTNRTSKECSNHTTAMQGNKREIQKKKSK